MNHYRIWRLSCLVVALFLLTCSRAVFAAQYPWPESDSDVLGEPRSLILVYEDTFAKIARIEGIGYDALKRRNPSIDEWLPGAGTELEIPSQLLLPNAARQGVLINLSELRLYFFDTQQKLVFVYPIGVGSEATATPVMHTTTVSKIEDPVWYPPASIRERHAQAGDPLPAMVEPGPANPLGRYAIQLARSGYFIHGTNQPIGVGRRISSGCIRLFDRHISALVQQVPNGTEVRVIKQPYQVGWHQGALYLEAHTPTQIKSGSVSYTDFVRQIVTITEDQPADIDWDKAMSVVRAGQGVPVRITR